MNISTLVNYLFILGFSASSEVSAQINSDNGVEIEDMVVRIMDQTKLLMFGPKITTEII